MASALVCLWLLFGLSVVAARAQQVPLGTYTGFNGRTVTRVNIAVGPSVDAATYRRLVQQRAGQPFSISAIEKSVGALQATKKFSQVQLSIEPQETGLSLLFILQPASYVGVIEFPEAAKVLPYTRLLQAVNIPEQTPYYNGLLAQGQKALLSFLHRQGYFQAVVHAGIERNDAYRIVNLIFHTDLGKRAKVGKISLEGVPPQEVRQILAGLGSLWSKMKLRSLKPGKEYSPGRIQKAIDYMRNYMVKQNRPAARVSFLSPKYDKATNRADLKFKIDPGPLVLARVKGADVSRATVMNALSIYSGETVNKYLAHQGEQGLENYLQSKGYFKAKVSTHFKQEPGRVQIRYDVRRGPRYRVGEVTFRGNRHFDEDRLEALSAVKEGHSLLGYTFTRGKFNQALVNKTADELKSLYADYGYTSVSIHSKIKVEKKKVHVEFMIDEGPQDKVASLHVEGNRTQPLSVLSGGKPFKLAPGKPYSHQRLEMDRNQILAAYLNLGYLNAKFKAKVMPSSRNPHSMNVVYMITEGPQGHISAVVPVGEKITKPGFLKNEAERDVSKGKPLSQGAFYKAESRLYKLNIFDWVSVKPLQPISTQTQDELLVKVHESKRYTMNIGGGLEVIPRSANIPVGAVALPGLPVIALGNRFTVSQRSFLGPRFSFSIARHNIMGRAETATMSTLISRLDQSGGFTYADPRLHGSAWTSLFSVSGERTTENPLYTAVLGRASFQVDKTLNARRTQDLVLRYSFQRTDLSNILIPNLVLPQDQRVRLSTFSANYVRDTRNNPLDAHRGVFQTFSFGVTPTALGSSANFFRLTGQTTVYTPVRHWLTWVNNFRLGLAIPFAGSAVPLSERFFSGGANSLRGFPFDGAGPQRPLPVCSNPSDPSTCTLISVPVGGDMLFIFNSEARFPLHLMRNLGGVIFYDGGNVYRNINFKQLVNDYTNTVGAGLRYKTPVGPIRFDVGYRLTPVPGVRAVQYFVTVGETF